MVLVDFHKYIDIYCSSTAIYIYTCRHLPTNSSEPDLNAALWESAAAILPSLSTYRRISSREIHRLLLLSVKSCEQGVEGTVCLLMQTAQQAACYGGIKSREGAKISSRDSGTGGSGPLCANSMFIIFF